jgi:hypothetical protein
MNNLFDGFNRKKAKYRVRKSSRLPPNRSRTWFARNSSKGCGKDKTTHESRRAVTSVFTNVISLTVKNIESGCPETQLASALEEWSFAGPSKSM